MKQIRNWLLLLTILILSNPLSGHSQENNTSWTVNVESSKTFIENKGQFPVAYKNKINGADVLYAYDGKNEMIYFTSKGVVYCFKQALKKNEDGDKDEEVSSKISHVAKEAEERRVSYKTDIINFTWENANPNVIVTAENETPDYFSYSFYDDKDTLTHVNNIKGFKKLVYKNLYSNIDVEYTFHPTQGIKYSLIIHPGADISKVKMNYSGKMKLKNDGNIYVPTLFGDIIDHAPETFYTGNKASTIQSNFVITDKSVSFHLDSYDNTKSITIDPWAQTPLIPTSHAIMECERDAAGNVYIIGGESPMQLLKYNATGTIQWTYNTPYDSANFWLGTFAVDLAGNSYVTAGSVARLEKVSTTAAVQWTWAPGIMASDEYWNIAFNCDQTKLIVGGTTGSMVQLYGAIFDINTSNGSVNSNQIVGYGNMFGFPPIIEEARSISSCRNARYYYLTLDTIGCIDQNLSLCPSNNPSIFQVNHSYSFAYKMENYRPANGNGCIAAIKANRYFVYTQNGTSVAQRSLSTGAVLNSVTLPGGLSTTTLGRNQVGNSGLDIDTCGNVYVGSGNGVYKFDSNLNLITSVATTYKVYDVAVSTGGNVIICGATGTNTTPTRVGTVQSINMGACNPMSLYCCDANICPAGPFCNTDPAVTLVAATPGGIWSGPGVNASTGVFDPATAGPGTHTIIYTLACGSDSTTIIVNACATLTACLQTNGNITVSGGTAPYTWQQYNPASSTPINTQTDCQACGYTWLFGTCLNGVIPVTDCTTPASWSPYTTGTTITPPIGHDTLMVSDLYNNSLTINDYTTLALCAPCPTLTINPTVVNVVCFGNSTGSITVTPTGGASPYSYTLVNSGGTTIATFTNITGAQSFTSLPADVYTLNVTDINGCPGTATVTITQPASGLVASTTNIVNTTCAQNNGSATASGSGGSGTYTYSWGTVPVQNTALASNLAAGTYTVTVNDGSCTSTASATIAPSAGPTTTITNIINETCGNANGGQQ